MAIKSSLKTAMKKTVVGAALVSSLVGSKVASANTPDDVEDKAPMEERVSADKEWEMMKAEHDRLPDVSELSKGEKKDILKAKKEITRSKEQIKKWFETLRTMEYEIPAPESIEKMVVSEYADFTIPADAIEHAKGKSDKKVRNPLVITLYGKTSVFDGSIGRDNPLDFFPRQEEQELVVYRLGEVSGKKTALTEEDFNNHRGVKKSVSLRSNGDLEVYDSEEQATVHGTVLDEAMPHFSIERRYETEGPYARDTMEVTEYTGDLGPETSVSHKTEHSEDGEWKVVERGKGKTYKGCLSNDLHPGLRVISIKMGPHTN